MIIKLSDERVREILVKVGRSGQGEWSGEEMGKMVTSSEVAALAQAVLDLRTANGLLEATIERIERSAGL